MQREELCQEVSGLCRGEHWGRAETCREWLEQTMISAQTGVCGEVISEVGGGRVSRKHHYSREFEGITERYRVLSKMKNRWHSKKRSLRRMTKLVVWVQKVLGNELPRLSTRKANLSTQALKIFTKIVVHKCYFLVLLTTGRRSRNVIDGSYNLCISYH